MIHKLSTKLSDLLIDHGLSSENREIYTYGAECFFNFFISDILLISLGLFTHHLPEILLWDISFVLLRQQMGGIHANSHFICILSSVLIGGCCLLLNTFLNFISIASYLILLIAFPVITMLVPVSHPNHPISKIQAQHARQKSIFLFFAEAILSLLLFFFYRPFAWPIISGIFSASILCIIGYFKFK